MKWGLSLRECSMLPALLAPLYIGMKQGFFLQLLCAFFLLLVMLFYVLLSLQMYVIHTCSIFGYAAAKKKEYDLKIMGTTQETKLKGERKKDAPG